MNENELSWAAGLFEGEGHIGVKRNRSKSHHSSYVLRVAVAMTDREPPLFFHEHWKGHLHERNYGVLLNARSQVKWEAQARLAETFLLEILPYLKTERVRAKAELGLEFQAQKLSTGGGAWADEAYHDLQVAYFERFHALNAVGLGAS